MTSKNKLIVANISYVIGSILISFGLSSLFAPTEQMINKHVFALAIGFFSIIYSIGWLIASDDQEMKKYTINPKTWKKKPCSEDRMDSLLDEFRYCSWFCTLKEVKEYVKAKFKRNQKFLITKGFKHATVYDVWYR